jgi:GR25 family glycosyltransferase involved in LPS biosynthesis
MLEKFRYKDYIKHYPGGTLCIDADVWVSPDAPDVFELVPEDKIGVSISDDLLPHGLMPKFNAELAEVCKSQGIEVPVEATKTHWNSGLVVMRPKHEAYWNPPSKPFPQYWIAEELCSKVNTFTHGFELFNLPHPSMHWQWWRDQPMNLIGPPLPAFIHPAGMTQQPNGLQRRLDLFRALEAAHGTPTQASAYLINLDRRPDRLAEAGPAIEKAGYQFIRFPAVDGNKAGVPKGYKAGGGAYGCKLSHVAVLKDAISRGLDTVTVFEDDVVFVDGFQEKLAELMQKVNEIDPAWQAVFLGGQHMKPPVRVKDNVVLCTDCHRTHAYVVRGEYIKKLLEVFEGTETHIDHAWGAHQVADKPKIYAPDQWLCGQSAGKSDINGRQLAERFWKPSVIQKPKPIQRATPKVVTAQAARQAAGVAPARTCSGCGKPKTCCGKACRWCEANKKPSEKVDFTVFAENAKKFGFTS